MNSTRPRASVSIRPRKSAGLTVTGLAVPTLLFRAGLRERFDKPLQLLDPLGRGELKIALEERPVDVALVGLDHRIWRVEGFDGIRRMSVHVDLSPLTMGAFNRR
jgi:hypothetical protein